MSTFDYNEVNGLFAVIMNCVNNPSGTNAIRYFAAKNLAELNAELFAKIPPEDGGPLPAPPVQLELGPKLPEDFKFVTPDPIPVSAPVVTTPAPEAKLPDTPLNKDAGNGKTGA